MLIIMLAALQVATPVPAVQPSTQPTEIVPRPLGEESQQPKAAEESRPITPQRPGQRVGGRVGGSTVEPRPSYTPIGTPR